MAEPSLSMALDDDLPRTLRREREARERAARDREGPSLPGHGGGPQPMAMRRERAETYDLATPAPAATVTAIDMSFAQLTTFLLKVVIAGIPALLLLTVLLWGLGQTLQMLFPALLKMKIVIYVPQ